MKMDRREALKATTLFLGYTLTASTAAAILNGCKADKSIGWEPKTFSVDQGELLAEVCEAIFPKTDTPGAKDALCHRWIDEYVTNFKSDEEKTYLKESLSKFDKASKDKYSKAFVSLNPSEKDTILGVLAKEAQDYKDDSGKKPHIFSFVKNTTVSGYFSSEVGATGGLLDFKPVPGPYQGCVPYTDQMKTYVL
jgi:hypothetical protein